MSETPVLAIKGIEMRYLAVRALAGIDLSVSRGEVIGYIGPNGAGKTTTLAIAATLLRPTKGRVRLLGEDAFADVHKTRARIGYMPEQPGIYDDMRAAEYLQFFCDAQGVDGSLAAAKIKSSLAEMGLEQVACLPLQALSKGMKQKLFFASTFLHSPPLLLLDEPFSGIDPDASRAVRAKIRAEALAGKAFVISSHDLGALEQVSTRVVMIRNGKLISDAPLDDPAPRVIYDVEASGDRERVASLVRERFGGSIVSGSGDLMQLELATSVDAREVLAALVRAELGVASFARRRASLRDRYEEKLDNG